MPCRSDYLAANNKEVAMSQVACLLDELNGISLNKTHWDGYHPNVYNMNLSKSECDKMVEKLCSKLQEVDVSEYSLEMQMWWRDHKKADKERLENDLKKAQSQIDKQNALNKLTDYEKGLLGL